MSAPLNLSRFEALDGALDEQFAEIDRVAAKAMAVRS